MRVREEDRKIDTERIYVNIDKLEITLQWKVAFH